MPAKDCSFFVKDKDTNSVYKTAYIDKHQNEKTTTASYNLKCQAM